MNKLAMFILLLHVSALLQQGDAQIVHRVSLDGLDVSKIYQGIDRPRDVGERAGISIRGIRFLQGVHTRTESRLYVALDGKADTFSAWVGIDDRSSGHSTAEFFLIGDGAILWRSGIMRVPDSARHCVVRLEGVRRLLLEARGGRETAAGAGHVHVDWADARMTYSGACPYTVWSPEDMAVDRHIPQPPQPRINGAMAVGIRPGTPFFYPVAVTGKRPFVISVEGLPEGLHFDRGTGIIRGVPETRGDYRVRLTVRNSAGSASRLLRIAVGDTLALTPPMGFLSWNVIQGLVSATVLKEMGDAFVRYGLRDVGYQYIMMDDCWAGGRDAQGNIYPDSTRFPDGMKAVGDYLHEKGFKLGIYSSPAAVTCAGYPGTLGHELQDAHTWTGWGVDYLKYDLCSTPRDRALDLYRQMGGLLERSGRSVVYALGAGGAEGRGWGATAHAQVWRTGVDIRDQWKMDWKCGIIDCFDAQESFAGYQHPGAWNDPDMLLAGIYGKGASSNDLGAGGCNDTEYRSQMSLWSLLSAPLFISADVRNIRPSALKILTNPEVIDVDQDILGNPPVQRGVKGDLEIWVKELADGSKAIGLLNRRDTATGMTVHWADVGLSGKQGVRDLWLRKDIGSMETGYSTIVPPHGVALIRVYQEPDLRGPVLSDQFKVNTSGDGVSMTDFTYKPFPSSTLNGSGHWIWIDPVGYPDQQATETNWIGKRKEGSLYVVNFKKVINIEDDVAYANIKLSADVQYRVFINGRLSGRGPANIGSDYADHLAPRHWFYDQFDTRHSFKKGINVIAIEVSTLNKTASFTTMGRGGLILAASIHLRSGKVIPIGTDSSWVCEPSAEYRPGGVVDASKETAGWITSPVCDKTWSHAVVLPDSISSRWKLRQSELPQMMEKRIFPVKITREGPDGDTVTAQYPLLIKASGAPQKIRLEFDNLYTGYLGFRVSGKAGTKLDLVTGELAGSHAQEMKYILSEGAQTYESPHLMDGKYVDVTITNPGGDLTIDDIEIDYSSFPVSYLGDFSCSDPFLNALWKNVRWITQMNMQTYHMDSPLHQEPVSDAGDYLIESLVNYYAFSSPLLVKQDLRKIALILEKTGYRMFHTSYMLLWVQMLVHYYEYTGDKALLKELAPDVYKLLDRFHSYVGDRGIITNAPNYMFMDWGSIDGIEFHHPPASLGQGYMTAFYYKGLMEGKRIAGYLGDDRRSGRFSTEAETLKKAFVDNLYDRNDQLFKNGLPGTTTVEPNRWMPRDTAIGLDLPYVNTLAVLYGLAPAGAQDSIIRYVLAQKEVTPSPYFMYFVFDAMAEAGDFNRYGMEQLRRWKVLSQHPVGLKEGWTMGDYSHAWGGSPAYELSSRVLGVTPAKPGFAEVFIAPHPGDLDSASGVVPTPRGNVSVHWRHTPKDFVIGVSNPVNMPVIFVLPHKGVLTLNGKSIRRLTGNGQRIQALPGGPDTMMIMTGGGNNTIEMTDNPAMRAGAQQVMPGTLDRKAIVTRHNVVVTTQDPQSPVQVGNGEFAFGADVTGLQTFEPFVTMSQWGWHSFPLPAGLSVDSFHGVVWETHGRPVTYEINNTDQPELSTWLAENPHRLNLGRIGFRLTTSDGRPAQLTDIKNVRQTLDLWQGMVTSYFELDGVPVKVITACHGSLDAIGVRVESALIKQGRLAVTVAFPYGNTGVTGADWTKPGAHRTTFVLEGLHRAIFKRQVDSTRYDVYVSWTTKARLTQEKAHQFLLTPSADAGVLEFSADFSRQATKAAYPTFNQVTASARAHWKAFWESGGAIDLSESKDSRWKELERRIVLSQYLMGVNEAGSLPPQESGLANNSGWYGRFHYEMYWWHAAHYALWNRWGLLDKSIGVYRDNLQSSVERARKQGYAGARWPKCTGPDGRNGPHPIHALLIWQQPHPLFFAEMDYQAHPTRATLEKWKDIVMKTASFMASYAFYDSAKRQYVLGPPVYMVGESNDPKTTQNPIFELAYWRFGLRVAQTWRERLGLPRDAAWDRVLNGLSPLPQQAGLYVSFEGVKDMWTKWNWEHPSLVGIFGMLPGDGVDTAVMERTFTKVLDTWDFGRTWGWDFPMLAMCAAKLGHPEKAVDMLMYPGANFQFDEHGLATGGPFPYFPSNGALLYAVAMMAAGWSGVPGGSGAPGFPADGSWTVKWEGLKPAL